MHIVAIISHKGGTGKTSFVQNVGAELAQQGHRVLLVDADPQANLTSGWGLVPEQIEKTLLNALIQPDVTPGITYLLRPNLSLLPSSLDLATAEGHFSRARNRQERLRKVLATVKDYFDIVLIDTPPSLGFFTANAMGAAQSVIITVQTEIYSYNSVPTVLNFVKLIREGLNRDLMVMGMVLTMADTRNTLANEVITTLRKDFGEIVFSTVVARNIRIAEAPGAGKPVGEYDPTSRGAIAYRALAEEVEARLLL